MARIKHTPDIEEIRGARGGLVERRKTFYNFDGTVAKVGRLEASIRAGLDMGLEPLVFLHYPPVYGDYVCEEIMEILQKYGVRKCLYGHLHGTARAKAITGDYNGIHMRLISADHVGFVPQLVLPDVPESPVTNS